MIKVVFILVLSAAQVRAALLVLVPWRDRRLLMPDEVKTRFADVWGQDHVLERVQENIIFLEHPEMVEDRGGYVPGGVLLWRPPGTGKTLMAEAVMRARMASPTCSWTQARLPAPCSSGVGRLKVKATVPQAAQARAALRRRASSSSTK